MQTATGQYGLFQLPVSGGTPTPISSPFTRAELLDVAPYGDQLLVVAQESQGPAGESHLDLTTAGRSSSPLG